jgi:hypothetical protein
MRCETLPFGNAAECLPHRAFAYSVSSVTADATEQSTIVRRQTTKITPKTLLLIAAPGALSASGVAAFADAPKGQPVEGAAIALDQLPHEVRGGSV